MNGVTKPYRFYPDSSNSYITIPIDMRQSLGWQNGDSIHILIKTDASSVGLFLYKNNGGETTNYFFRKERSKSRITIPKSVAKSLDWKDKDTIYIEPREFDGHQGLFLQKLE